MGNQKDLKGNSPVEKFKAGAVSATIWENKGKKDDEEFTYYTVNIERNHTDDQKEWQKTSSMRVNDLPKVRLVAEKAFDYLMLKK